MLEIRNLSVVYQGNVKALSDVNLELREGKIYGIVGPSGSGKSSLVKGILDLVPIKGTVTYRGIELKKLAKETAYVEQKESIDRNFPITVYQCVLMGTYPSLKKFIRPGSKERGSALHAIEQVGLSKYTNRQIGELSGGQFQRVLIARALAQNPTLLFMDEPFEGIDIHNEEIVVEILKGMAKQGKTIMIIHHGLEKVFQYFDEIIMLNQHVIAHGSVEETFTLDHFLKTFGVILPALFQKDDLKTI